MVLTTEQIQAIENVLRNSLRHRFQNYKPEPAAMPFHTRLLGKDRMALFSFIHSLNTNFGTSIFEPVALALASSKFKVAKSQVIAGTQMSENPQFEIQQIMDELTAANIKPNKITDFGIFLAVKEHTKIC
ncbi:MAG: TdeIII family type II restriction endonuclease [Limnohabitans sp.]|nr:TdeIII family type II restriction endonuclease [Limnohabitans sp.]